MQPALINERGIIDLGTLKSDNTGNSTVSTISTDAQVIVGSADNDHDKKRHAFIYTPKGGMVELGTFRTDNTDSSASFGLSFDGTVVLG